MKLTKQERTERDQLIDAAQRWATHGGASRTRSQAAEFVAQLEELEGLRGGWIAPYLRSLTITGAMAACANRRRRLSRSALTKKGLPVSMPAFASGTKDGLPVQLPLDSMTVEQVDRHRRRLAATRDTLSREIAVLNVVLEQMASDPSIRTVGEALARQVAA